MTTEQLLQEFTLLEEIGRSLAERCCKAKNQLERIHAPAPKRGKGLSAAEKASFLAKHQITKHRPRKNPLPCPK